MIYIIVIMIIAGFLFSIYRLGKKAKETEINKFNNKLQAEFKKRKFHSKNEAIKKLKDGSL